MGCSPSFPRKYRPIAYEPQCRFTDTGRYVDSQRTVTSPTSFFHIIHTYLWEKFISERKRRHEAKARLKDMKVGQLLSQFPMWTEQDILDFKLRFQMLDLNGDGLLDENEINQLLDELGDTSTNEERRQRFIEIDTDESDGVDFVEFLKVIQLVQAGSMTGDTGMGALCARESEGKALHVQRLSVLEQMAAGVF